MLFRTPRQLPNGWHALEHFFAALAQLRIEFAGENAREIVGEGSDVFGDRHVVVVENHQQIDVETSRMIQRFEGHAGAHRAIADDRDHAAVDLGLCGCDCHSQGRADGGAGVTDAEGVVCAFLARREWSKAAMLLDGVQLVAASGQHLVRISLMAYVPYDPVVGRVKDIVQGDGELHRAQARGEMPAHLTHGVNQVLAQLGCNGGQLIGG